MKRKVVSVVLALTMVAGMAVGCGSSKPAETTTTDDAAAEETTDATEETDAADTADAAAEAVDGDLADKKVGVCIYQFSDNFMTLFRTNCFHIFCTDHRAIHGVAQQLLQFSLNILHIRSGSSEESPKGLLRNLLFFSF